MSEENQTNPSQIPEAQVQNQDTSHIISPPDSDASLNDALGKFFDKASEPTPNENPTPESKIDNVESKPEPKAEVVPKPDKVESPKAELPNPESITATPPGKGSKSSVDGWNALRNNYKIAHRTIQERDEKIIKLEKALAEKGTTSTQEVEALKKQIEELNGFRAMVDIQADPEFTTKFDVPFNKGVDQVKSMLLEMRVTEEALKGKDFSDVKFLKTLAGMVMANKDSYTPDELYTSKKLQTKIEDIIELSEKRDETVREQKTKYKEHLENKKKESFNKTAENEGRKIKYLEEKSKSVSFLSRSTPKEGATEAEIGLVNKHNEMVDKMNSGVKEVLAMNTPEQEVERAIAAVSAVYFQSKLKEATEKIENLQNQLKKLSAVTSDTEKTRQAIPRSNHSYMDGNGNVKDVDSALSEFMSQSR